MEANLECAETLLPVVSPASDDDNLPAVDWSVGCDSTPLQSQNLSSNQQLAPVARFVCIIIHTYCN